MSNTQRSNPANWIGTKWDNDAYDEHNIIKRARLLNKEGVVKFADVKYDNQSGAVTQVKNTSVNIQLAIDALFAGGSGRVPYPHFDTFRGIFVAHDGVALSEGKFLAELMLAVQAFQISSHSHGAVKTAYETLAADYPQRNSLIETFQAQLPEWDGKPRIRNHLVNFFNLRDTAYNHVLSEYFWMSIYGRINYPGCDAPVAAVFIGAQDTGKSYLIKRIVQAVLGEGTDGVVLTAENLSGSGQKQAFQWITGASFIAYFNELAKWSSADLGSVKSFITRTIDTVDLKYKDPRPTPRQFVLVCDGNEYNGLQRDATGNRRLAPIFINQGEDKDGQPWWPAKGELPVDFCADFNDFDNIFWQLMAECETSFRRGLEKFAQVSNAAKAAVSELSMYDLDNQRGGFVDEDDQATLRTILLGASFGIKEWKNGIDKTSLIITNSDLKTAWINAAGHQSYRPRSVKNMMKAIGFDQKMIAGYGQSYYIDGIGDARDFKRMVWINPLLVKKWMKMTEAKRKKAMEEELAAGGWNEIEAQFDTALKDAMTDANGKTGF